MRHDLTIVVRRRFLLSFVLVVTVVHTIATNRDFKLFYAKRKAPEGRKIKLNVTAGRNGLNDRNG
jgi:hypothetical protein